MLVFRITTEKWANQLAASGRAARWNPAGKFVIYTAGSTALACLENVVHWDRAGLSGSFKLMKIEIPAELKIEEIAAESLPENWKNYENYAACQKLGEAWLLKNDCPVLKVPSAIVPHESNFLLKPAHPDFQKIKLVGTESFAFDPRIKSV